MSGMCIKLVYGLFLGCYINTADMKLCGPRIEDFRPIYTMYNCPMSSNTQVFLDFLNSGPKVCR